MQKHFYPSGTQTKLPQTGFCICS